MGVRKRLEKKKNFKGRPEKEKRNFMRRLGNEKRNFRRRLEFSFFLKRK